MGKYCNVSLDRDHAFDMDSLNELLSRSREILTQAVSISERMETSISAISGIYGGIDGEYKVRALGSDIARLSGKLEKQFYQDTIDLMEKLITKLTDDMPSYDNSLAHSVDGIQELLGIVKGRVDELKGLLEAEDMGLPYTEFVSRLKDLKAGWTEATGNLEELLAEIANDLLGVSVSAVLYSSDPVNLSTGNFVYDHEDLRIGGEIPLSFHRYYNAKDRGRGSLGRCFVHNYESRLEENMEKGKVTISMGDGQKKTFQKAEDGTYRGLHSATEILSRDGDAHVLAKLSGERTIYNAAGQMIRREDRHGRGITFIHDDASRLAKALSDNGMYLAYSYDGEGQLVRVTDHTGRSVGLSYEKGKLAGVRLPGGGVYAYRYGKNGRIEEAVNPRGYVSVRNTYDEKRRVMRQEFPDGGSMEYAYDDGRRQVVLTERNGSRITYIHDSRYRNTDILYEDGTREHFGYNGKNQRVLHTDRNGNTTRMAYDSRGNLTQVINALGEKTSMTYNADGRLVVLKVNGKEKLRNSYDRDGNLAETSDALSRRTTFTYNGAGLPESVIQPDGSTIHMDYDEKGNITRITDAAGGKTFYVYDGLNRVTQVTDPRGSQTGLAYDQAGNIRTMTNAAGDVRIFEYNESGRVTAITDFNGGTVRRTYNALNRPEEVTDQLGRTTRLWYDAMWNLVRITMPDGAETHYHYDRNNRLEYIKDAAGNTVSYTYDGNGNSISRKDQMGNMVCFSYDACGRLTHAWGEGGAEMSYAYDAEGRVAEVRNALGNRVCMEYDEAGQLTRETSTTGTSRVYTYSPLGKVESVTDEAGRVTAYTYLPGGRLSEVVHGDGTRESYTYDANGNISTHTGRNGVAVTYEYDSLDRVIRSSGGPEGMKEYTYDAAGNVVSVTDARGHSTRYEYSLTGCLTKATDAMGNETEYLYDVCDRLMEIRQYGGGAEVEALGPDGNILPAEIQNRGIRTCHATCYRRNRLGQVEAITDALGHTEHYTYDARGQLVEKLDKEGYLTKYGYTVQGDVNYITYADGREVRLSYNPLRQLEEMEDWLGITRIENDAMGRAAKVRFPDGREVSYTYGKSGERTSITYPDGREAGYLYDSRLRLSGLRDDSGTIEYSYDEYGRLARKTFPNGMETSYAYDAAGRLAELIHRDREGILDRYAYQYDPVGNKTSIEKQRRGLVGESGFYAYGYDALGRLGTVTRNGERIRTYEYDAFGNRSLMREGNTEIAYSYNAVDQLVGRTDAGNEETYVYDRRGNLSLIMENGVLKNQYTYGTLNRLEQAVNGKGEAASYIYNGLGYRVGKTTGILEEDTSALLGTDVPALLERSREQAICPEKRIQYIIDLTRSYHNLLQKEEDGNIQTYLWDGNVAGMADGKNAGSMYYLQDELGSPVRLLDNDGNLEETYGYDEFGQDLYGNQGVVQPFGYTGYQSDQTAGTYFAQAREYIPLHGRFLSKDKEKFYKMAKPASWNLYAYCAGNSLRYVDPQGNDSRDGIDTVIDYATGKWDGFGIKMGLHWLYGDGEAMEISSDSTSFWGPNMWQVYMENNPILLGKVGDVVIPIGESLDDGESIEVDMSMSMIIDNGEDAIGYQFMHGTDATVGGFQITGSVSKDNKGNTTYDLTYTWNDVMNPNIIYDSDVAKANAALSIPGADPKDYEFHLSWHDKTVIKKKSNIFSWNSGWLMYYHSDWSDRLNKDDKDMLKQINNEQVEKFGALSWPDQLQEIYGMYSSYYDCEVLD